MSRLEVRLQVIKGGFYNYNNNTSIFLRPSPRFMPFFSSTFDDTHLERNILLEDISGHLQEIGARHGIDVIIVDMRTGIPEEIFADHMTWQMCLREIKRCRDEGSGLCFVSLQASRYGTMFLPRTIEKSHFEKRLEDKTVSERVREIARHW